jgi:DNA/RNA endonuclease YhcR with UshA esterase domain
MKMVAPLFTFLGLLGGAALAQDAATNAPAAKAPITISASQAKDHTNEEAVITGIIVDVHNTSSVVHLNFDKPYPNQTFTAVIFGKQISLFPDVEKLKGKTVEVSGRIVEYNHRPEIVLSSTNQLKVLEKAVAPAQPEKK